MFVKGVKSGLRNHIHHRHGLLYFFLYAQVKEYQVETIVDTLCTNMVSEKEQLRDISSIGLKTVIIELPPTATSLASSICKKITGRLTSAVTKQVLTE